MARLPPCVVASRSRLWHKVGVGPRMGRAPTARARTRPLSLRGGEGVAVGTGRAGTIARVPTISTFHGILIRMYFGDRLVREWTSLHRADLEENWRRCEERVPLSQVEPLP